MRENILEKHAGDDLAVYSVWLPILATDQREEWDPGTLPDPRVRHYWNGGREIGLWLAQKDVGGYGYQGVVYDAFFVYGAGDTDLAKPRASGVPVIAETDALAAAIDAVLG